MILTINATDKYKVAEQTDYIAISQATKDILPPPINNIINLFED